MSGSQLLTAGEIGSFRGGSGFPTRFQGQRAGELPFFKVSDMSKPGNELFMDHANNYISESQRKAIGAVRFPKGAIVFAKVGGAIFLERKRILARDSCIDNNMAAFILDADKVDIRFTHHLLTNFRMSSLVATTALPSLNGGQLRSIPLLIPKDIEDQRRIAAALGDVDDLILSLERLTAKKLAIKQAMMQQLLTGKSRLPGFTDPWTKTTLGAVGTLLKGRGIKRSDVRRTGVRCIRYGELYTAFDGYTSESRSFVSPDISKSALALRSGDLLFAASGERREEIGKCVAYIGPIPAVAGGDIIVLRGDQFNAIYLALLVNTPEVVTQKARAGQGDAVVHIYSRGLEAIEVNLPPLAEQGAIAEVIVDADGEIRVLEDRLAKARDIKQGMMQELLTGRTHLPAAEVAA